MTREAIVDLLTRREAAFNRHDAQTLASIYAMDCVVDSPLAAGTLKGRQALTKVHEALFNAFPDILWARDQVMVDGHWATFLGTFTGTYTGGFMGLPPSGKPVRIPVALVCEFRDGEIVYERRLYDFTGMLVQIGVLKTTSA
jgi:steroid delta-isomerase-like uncharacterized protein